MKKVTATFNPETHKIVPIEPTDDMLKHTSTGWHYSDVYRAMVKAAPEYPTEPAVTHCDASGPVSYTEREIIISAIYYIKSYACSALSDLENDKDVKCYKKLKALAGMSYGYCPELDKHYDRLGKITDNKAHIDTNSGYVCQKSAHDDDCPRHDFYYEIGSGQEIPECNCHTKALDDEIRKADKEPTYPYVFEDELPPVNEATGHDTE